MFDEVEVGQEESTAMLEDIDAAEKLIEDAEPKPHAVAGAAPQNAVLVVGKTNTVLPAVVEAAKEDMKPHIRSMNTAQAHNRNLLAAPHQLSDAISALGEVKSKKAGKRIKARFGNLILRMKKGVAAWEMKLDKDDEEIQKVGGWFKRLLATNFERKGAAIALMNYYYVIANVMTRCGGSKVKISTGYTYIHTMPSSPCPTTHKQTTHSLPPHHTYTLLHPLPAPPHIHTTPSSPRPTIHTHYSILSPPHHTYTLLHPRPTHPPRHTHTHTNPPSPRPNTNMHTARSSAPPPHGPSK
jgi:hypothetical protein